MSKIFALMAVLPEIVRLINRILSKVSEISDKKVLRDDIKKINRAFELGDASLLDELWKRPDDTRDADKP